MLSSSLDPSKVGSPSGLVQSPKEDWGTPTSPHKRGVGSGTTHGDGTAGGEAVSSQSEFQTELAARDTALHEDSFHIEERSVVSAAEVVTASSIARIAMVVVRCNCHAAC
jgi:hypothetical protein